MESIVILGGGHNALVCATYLARAGHDVTVVERLEHVGGAAVSARAFADHDARLSRYSYLVSLMPQALIDDLGLDVQLRSRATASYTPYEREGAAHGLLVETDEGPVTQASFRRLTGSDEEYDAWRVFYAEVASLAEAVAPTLLDPLPRAADLRARAGAAIWSEIVDRPLGEAIERRFADDLVRGVVGTDGLIGTFASLHDPGLAQNRCFLYHLIGNGTGEWRVPVGGMGAVTAGLERAARDGGARIITGTTVTSVTAHPDHVTVEAESSDGPTTWSADRLLAGVAPWTLASLRGQEVAQDRPSGSQLKINLLVSRLPALRSGDDPEVAFAGTFHVNESMRQVDDLQAAAARGEQPYAAGELYCHTLTDRSILGPELAASSAQTLTWFGLHLPYENANGPEVAERGYRQFLQAMDEHLAEPLEPLVLGVEVKTPRDIEESLAMPGGHIFHGDLAWPWLGDDEVADTPAARWGVQTDHQRILLCGSGARRGGAVSGIAGHNAAHALLDVLAAEQ